MRLDGDVVGIRSAIRECFETSKGPLTMRQTKAWIADRYNNRFEPLVIYSQVTGSCQNLDRAYTKKDRIDAPKILYYERSSKTYQLFESVPEGSTTDSSVSVVSDNVNSVQKRVDEQVTFFLERHLRDYLVNNLHILETGLELYSIQPSAVEYCVDGTFIDILAKDVAGTPVVIELKVKKAYDRVIGQALLYRYMNLTFDLQLYISNNFPGLELGGGLFFRWPCGLRFVIGLNNVVERAVPLYEECFGKEEFCIVVAQDWDFPLDHKPGDLRLKSLFSLSNSLKIPSTAQSILIESGDQDDRELYRLQWVSLPSRNFDYEEVMKQIANADQAEGPSISSRVYFINLNRNLIFHMYDDRGLDLISTDLGIMERLYAKYSNWIDTDESSRINEQFQR